MKHTITRFGIAVGILFFTFGAMAQTNSPSDAETQGQQLAQKIYYAAPETNFEQKGTLIVRHSAGTSTKSFAIFTTIISNGNWEVSYDTALGEGNNPGPMVELTIGHNDNQDNIYGIADGSGISSEPVPKKRLIGDQIMTPFVGSDFWDCDLGLEFLHWPDQKVIKKEFMRGRGCMVLESKNPNPMPVGYSRVDTWIDEETLGPVHAEAYDASGKLLKVFDPKSFKKVNGQWELQDMEIRNVQTGSRTRIEFDLGK